MCTERRKFLLKAIISSQNRPSEKITVWGRAHGPRGQRSDALVTRQEGVSGVYLKSSGGFARCLIDGSFPDKRVVVGSIHRPVLCPLSSRPFGAHFVCVTNAFALIEKCTAKVVAVLQL